MIFVLGLFLYAGDLKGYGTGGTEDEAKLNARKDLLTSIRVEVSVETTISLYDDGENSESTFFENAHSSSSGILKGVEETSKKSSSSLWEATCTIPASKAYLYENEIKNLIEAINNCQKEIDKGLEPKEEISYLEIQLKKYELFDFYSDILLMLGSMNKDKPGVGKEIIQSKFNVILDQLDKPTVPVVNSEKNAAEYKRLMEEYEERQKLKEQIEKQNQEESEQYQKKLSDEQKKLFDSFEAKAKKAYATLNAEESSTAITALVASYVEARTAFVSLFAENTATFEKLNASNIEVITATRKDIFNQPYDSLVEMKNGKPTEKALAVRTQKADKETSELIEAQNEVYLETYDNFVSSAEKFSELYNKIKGKINNKRFSISSLEEGSSFVVGRYDATTYTWPYAFSFSVLGHTFTVNGSLSNDEVKAKAKEAESNWKTAADYRSLVELYDALYHSEWALMAECSYSSTIDTNSGKVTVKIDSFKVTRLDNDSTLVSEKLDSTFDYSFTGSEPVSLVLYCLGKNQEDARKNAVSLFLGDGLVSLNVHDYSYADKDGFGLARVEISESKLSEIVTKGNLINSEYTRKKSAAEATGKGYEYLMTLLDKAEYVQKVLSCYGYSLPSALLKSFDNKDALRKGALNEEYSAIVAAGAAYESLTEGAKKIVDKAEPEVSVDISSVSNREAIEDFNTLVDKQNSIREKISSDTLIYKEEGEVIADYEDLQLFEREAVSKTHECVLPAGAFNCTISFKYGQNIEKTKISYVIKDEYKEEFGNFSFVITLKKIFGARPENIEDIEAYNDKVVAALALLTGDYNAFVVRTISHIETDSENLDGPVRSYDPFVYCSVKTEITVEINCAALNADDGYKCAGEVLVKENMYGSRLQSIDDANGTVAHYWGNYKTRNREEKKDSFFKFIKENIRLGTNLSVIVEKEGQHIHYDGSLGTRTVYTQKYWFFDVSLNAVTFFIVDGIHGGGLLSLGGSVGGKTPVLTLGEGTALKVESYLKAGGRCLFIADMFGKGGFSFYTDTSIFAGIDLYAALYVSNSGNVLNAGISIDYIYGIKTFSSYKTVGSGINVFVYFKLGVDNFLVPQD